MSINHLYEISRRSFRASQAGMNTAGQNVANADTEGYHRRRVEQHTDATVSPGIHTSTSGEPTTGNGVSLENYERVRDGLLEAAGRDAQSGLGQANAESRQLEALEGVLAPGGSQKLLDDMNAFFEGWNDVANHPTDKNVRSVLLRKADNLTSTLGGLDDKVKRIQANATTTLEDGVSEMNKKLDKIATLNHTVRSARQSGSPDLAAADQRDKIIRDLSKFAPVEVQQKKTGYTLTIQGKTVVQDDEATHLKFDKSSMPAQVTFGESDAAFQVTGRDDGKLGAWLHTANDTLPTVRGKLDEIAKSLVTEVNAKHQAGFGLTDTGPSSPGRNFFDPSKTTASNISVLNIDPEDIAAASAGDADGNSQQAQAIANFQDTKSNLFTDKATQMLTDVGSQLQSASSRATSRQAALGHVDGMIKGTSGVSVDEEMTKLIEFQQAFSASARVLKTAEETMDTLLRM